jgi:protein-tyrosine phosphatase
MYGSIFSEEYKASLQEIFHDLADPTNYPMYLHCTYGADRTGTIIFLIQGILGVDKDDMEREYALTGFWINGVTAKSLNPIYGGLEGTAGETINEKIVNYLVEEVGVPMSEIESIRSILLED